MQRRAAAVYFVLFVLLGAGAFGFIQVGMSKPHVEFQQAPEYGQNDTFTVDGRTYTVSKITVKKGEGGGGGHGGGGGGGEIVGELTWTNDSARATAALENGSTTTYRGETYRVVIENATNVTSFTLVAQQNVSAILANDPAVEDEPFTQGGVKYVRYVENGSLRRLSEYLPAPEREPFSVGDDYRYPAESGNVTATVVSVTPSKATLAWPTTETNPIELSEGTNVTLNGRDFFVHFVDENTVQILPVDQYYQSYQQQLERVDHFKERRNGVWGIVILSFVAGVILLSTAYMPVK